MSSEEVDDPPLIHHAFHTQALKTPDALCFIDGVTGVEWTYRDAQHRVLQLATELRDLGVTLETVVATYMEPSPLYIISLLAILSAGGAYVPLELAYPMPMLQKVLVDAVPVAVMTASKHKSWLPETTATILAVDDTAHREVLNEHETLESLLKIYNSWEPPTLDNLAFLIYSSGSTGQPKGIANPHRAPAVSYQWRFTKVLDYYPGNIVACSVFFVWEALRPIMRGAAVVTFPQDRILDGEQFSHSLEQFGVTEMLFTPSLLENLLCTVEDGSILRQRLAKLQTVYLNGEVSSTVLRQRCLNTLPKTRFINLYSISECHEVAAVDLIDIDTTISPTYCPVGFPSTTVYLLDEDQQPLPQGEAGELYVAGQMLARGYLNLPELTATRFVLDPFTKKGLMYRTGDRARILPNGQLEILGRCDFMVKIRGYSIVLGAVEAALMDKVCLTSCVVVADGEEGEDKHLVAYVVRETDPKETDTRVQQWTIEPRSGACPEIRHAVDGHIPHYMVPSVYIELETLPVSSSAKLDRKVLQAQTADRRSMLRSLQLSTETHTTAVSATATADRANAKQYSETLRQLAKYMRIPRGSPMEDVQAAMITLWEMVLNPNAQQPGSITLHSNFQEQGGHSLTAARLSALLNKVFGSGKFSAMRLFKENPTVQDLCEDIMNLWKKEEEKEETLKHNKQQHEATVLESPSESSNDWSVVEANHRNDDSTVNNPQTEKIMQEVREDSLLPPDIVFPSLDATPTGTSATPTTPTTVRSLKKARSILLTGATGFLGVHLLVEILSQNSKATVLCLVRSNDPNAVQKNLDRYNLSCDSSRIVTVRGDLSLPTFGMNPADWNHLTATVDAIVNCGAAVSLMAPYKSLKDVNVNGTLTAIRLAAACKAGTPFVHVSSNGIYPTKSDEVFVEDDDIGCLPERLGPQDGYGLSKWAAERLVTAAHKQGLPAMIIRYGNIGWHSISAIGNALDYQGMLLNGCIHIKQRPIVKGWKFECTPVDFAAKALVSLACDVTILKDGSIFNCVQDGFTSAEDVFRVLESTCGYTIPAIPFGAWKQAIEDYALNTNDASVTSVFAFVSSLQTDSYLKDMANLECKKLDAALAKIDPSMKRKDVTGKDYYKIYFQKTCPSLLPTQSADAIPFDPATAEQHQQQPTGPLAGKVAVVTGASSGIGRAIVEALVKAGCHVAMGARRIGELENTKDIVAKACPGTFSKTVIVKTDVTKQSDVAALVEKAEIGLGPVDIIVNCAGVMYFTLMKNVIWDQWERTVDVNCKGTMYGIGAVLPKMLQRGKGHIVNITSDAGRKSFPGLGIYSGSKFFVEAVSQALRAETASTGLRVTCIQPGNVETPLLGTSTDPEGLKGYGEPTGAKVLEPADIGRAVVYALTQPEWCAVNEILVEPREEPA